MDKPSSALSGGYGAGGDNWAVGCIIYEMLVGDPPFGDLSTQTEDELFRRILSSDVATTLKKVMKKVKASAATPLGHAATAIYVFLACARSAL